jgi:signal transduction histidine kinase
MAEPLRVLIVEDSEDDAALLVRELRRGGWTPTFTRVETAEDMRAALDREPWDLVVADYALPQFSAPAALAVLKERGLDLPFIIVSGQIGEEAAVAAMKAGAHDYLMKGNYSRLVPAIQRELREADDRRQRAAAEAALAHERERAEKERLAMEQAARRGEKLAALGTLSAGLAHELNNPIGIMSSRIELMLLEADAEGLSLAVREDLGVLHRHAQRVARIASGLLSFARQSSGERMPVDLNHVVTETLLLAEKQMTKEGITVRQRLGRGLPAILGDANTLQQVIMNLLTNAWDALDTGGEIVIETGLAEAPEASVRLVVQDNGPGIAPEVLPRIFDPFFSTKARGTGLGLSITDGIVREHGGTIDVESAPGQGTRFTLTFPVFKVTERSS